MSCDPAITCPLQPKDRGTGNPLYTSVQEANRLTRRVCYLCDPQEVYLCQMFGFGIFVFKDHLLGKASSVFRYRKPIYIVALAVPMCESNLIEWNLFHPFHPMCFTSCFLWLCDETYFVVGINEMFLFMSILFANMRPYI